MRKKEMLFSAVIGGVIGAVLVTVAGSIAPLGAQNDVKDAVFESITCKRIWVVDEDANLAVSINNGLIGNRGVIVHGKKDRGAVMVTNEHGGFIGVFGGADNNGVEMRVTEYGGHVGVFGKRDADPRVAINVNEYGNGTVGTWDKNGYRLATLK